MKTLRLWLLRYMLASDEQYLAACRRDGLAASLDLEAFDKRMQAMRVEIATLLPRIK